MAKNVLVIDADPLVRRDLTRALEEGWSVRAVGSTQEAMSALEGHEYVVAVIGIDHYDALVRLRTRRPTCAQVLRLGSASVGEIVAAVNAGNVAGILTRSDDPELVRRMVEGAASGSRYLMEATTHEYITRGMKDRAALDTVIQQRLVELHVQPIVRPDDLARPVAMEVLSRPQHAGFPSITDLLRAAERHHRVPQLGQMLLELVADAVGPQGPEHDLFINVHPHQLGDPERLERALAPLRPWASRLTLEITERSRLQEMEQWQESVKRIRRAGFALAVDDLGAGYSSFSMLAELQPRYIKLDMSLVRGLENDAHKRRLVQLIVTFAEATGAETVAEGVETQAEADALRACGAHLFQGFYVAPPAKQAM